MSDTNVAPGSDSEAIASIPASDDSPLSALDAARELSAFQRKQDETTETPAAPEEAAAAPLADEANAAAEKPPGEETATPEPEALPPIEPPRSWTKEEKAEFQTYPREAQEKIARREQDRETALRKGQNEIAEQRKAAEAERIKLEQAQRQYEATLPALYQALQTAQSGEFADIKTNDDVTKLAAEDWPRFARYQAHLMNVGSLEQEMRKAQERQQTEYKTKWSEFTAKEDALFLDKAPEMADKEKATKIADASVAMLKDLEFTEPELAKLWNGEASVSLRDHRVQLLIRDAVKFREAQKQTALKVAKPVPQVQKPGVAQPRGAAKDLEIQNLEKELERTGSPRVAAKLLTAQQQARSQ